MFKVQKNIFWSIFPTFSLLFAVVLSLVTLFTLIYSKNFYLGEKRSDLQKINYLIAGNIENFDEVNFQAYLESANQAGLRITLIQSDGVVVLDSDENSETMDNHSDRPEIMEARDFGIGSGIRYSNTLKTNMMYSAVKKKMGDSVGFIRVAIPLMSLEKILWNQQFPVIAISGFGLAMVFLLCFIISRNISQPISNLKNYAEVIAKGNFLSKIPRTGASEVQDLASSFESMSLSLKKRIETIEKQQGQLDAIFSSMKEGVIALDNYLNLLACNPAASNLFNMNINSHEGKPIYSFVRNSNLMSFIENLKRPGMDVPDELSISLLDKGLEIQVRGAPLLNKKKDLMGIILVFNDITRIKKLEKMREEFVANVSHELKTPITSIKGAAETLIDGAIENPKISQRFLDMIISNSERLSLIIEDILKLSRLENELNFDVLEKEEIPVDKLLDGAVKSCQNMASASDIEIKVNLDYNAKVLGNKTLLEQALINLISNAIKYSNSKTVVRVEGSLTDSKVQIDVIDEGPGIEKSHIARIFERFYRVDKARSRKMGGTGLGLSIVKHICQLHRGEASVNSEVGKGSRFRISLPILKQSS